MATKRNRFPDEEGGGDAWLATYGDMITLLMCFFVIFFSVSDVKKALQISDHKINLEISGNINKRTIVKYDSLGKLRISIGLLTKDIQAIDFSMLIQSKKTSNA